MLILIRLYIYVYLINHITGHRNSKVSDNKNNNISEFEKQGLSVKGQSPCLGPDSLLVEAVDETGAAKLSTAHCLRLDASPVVGVEETEPGAVRGSWTL